MPSGWMRTAASWPACSRARCIELLGKKGFGTPGDYLTDPMPPVGQLIGGELAWRQHEGGHDVTPNWPAFFEWVSEYITAPPVAKRRLAHGGSRSDEAGVATA